ncbi:MAG: DUF4340 domain-containing protein [Verrucomicrobiales bacterium]|nr:DUF4340 domain-containing protein [Verrucomicrobiales bacterium]
MNSRTTWQLLGIALALFTLILVLERRGANAPKGPPEAPLLFPNFDPNQVTSVEISRSNQVIHADRTMTGWQLASPTYPTAPGSVENMLQTLGAARQHTVISPQEIAAQPEGLASFGMVPSRAVLTLALGTNRLTVSLGGSTLIGGQIYAQIVGSAGLFVTDARLLSTLPVAATDWRDPALVLDHPVFDRLSVTNIGRVLQVQQNRTNQTWRLTGLMEARADSFRVQFLIQELLRARIARFVTDDPRANLDLYGLQTPDLQLGLANGTKEVFQMQFGKGPTNDSALIYAKRPNHPSIFLVPKEGLVEMLSRPLSHYRDHSLISFPPNAGIDRIEIRAEETVSLQRQSTGHWLITAPFQARADTELVQRLFEDLQRIDIKGFEAEVVTDFSPYGLERSARQYVFRNTVTNTAGPTNQLIAQLDFSRPISNRIDQAFARRGDEKSVYVVAYGDVAQVSKAAYQLRDRRLWDFSAKDVTSVTVSQRGRTRKLARNPTDGWSSDAILNAAIEETFHRLGKFQVVSWVDRGADKWKPFRLDFALTLEANVAGQPRTFALEFGKTSPSGQIYAASVLEGSQTVIFEFPIELLRDVLQYLSIPDEAASNP